MLFKKIISLFISTILIFQTAYGSGSCTSIGSTTYCSDGSSATRIGNTIYFKDPYKAPTYTPPNIDYSWVNSISIPSGPSRPRTPEDYRSSAVAEIVIGTISIGFGVGLKYASYNYDGTGESSQEIYKKTAVLNTGALIFSVLGGVAYIAAIYLYNKANTLEEAIEAKKQAKAEAKKKKEEAKNKEDAKIIEENRIKEEEQYRKEQKIEEKKIEEQNNDSEEDQEDSSE